MTDNATLGELLAHGDASASAIRTPGREALTYDGLRALSVTTLGVLNAAGIGRNDRIAIVLPNGPEMAAAFVSLAACATAAPLNPAYKAEEFEFYLSDLNAKAVIVLDGDESPAIEAAAKLQIPLIPLTPQPDGPAGAFSLALIAATPTFFLSCLLIRFSSKKNRDVFLQEYMHSNSAERERSVSIFSRAPIASSIRPNS